MLRFTVYMDISNSILNKDIKNKLRSFGAEQFVDQSGLNTELKFSFSIPADLSFYDIQTYLEYIGFVYDDSRNRFERIYGAGF